MYKHHPSIILINEKIGNHNKFSFEPVALSNVVKEINEINPNKSSIKDSIILQNILQYILHLIYYKNF